jgi:hypothetical protein
LIQNPGYAKNDSAEFDARGKINPKARVPKTNWNNSIRDATVKDSSTNL